MLKSGGTKWEKSVLYEEITRGADGDLIFELSTNPAFSEAVQDDSFAAVAFIDLSYHGWRHENANLRDATGTGAVSHLIASLRRRNETSLELDMAMNDLIFEIPKDELDKHRSALSLLAWQHGWVRE